MKIRALITVFACLFVVSVVALIMLFPSGAQATEKTNAQGNGDKTPPGLKKIPPGLEKIVFIHYKKGHAKPDKPAKPDRPGKPSGEPDCYGFMKKGLKWRNPPEICRVHPDLVDLVPGAISLGGDVWDDVTQEYLFSSGYIRTEDANWDGDVPDGRNELSFGNYSEPGVIAVTVVWGYFTGPPDLREILEFDILFDTDYEWGDCDDDPDKMDLQNIATHEFGHGLGLADIYTDGCSDVTMYGYSDYGDVEKRTLEAPDITAIRELYGAP